MVNNTQLSVYLSPTYIAIKSKLHSLFLITS